jgi:Ribbon-helix-helix protein, copG family
MQKIQILFPDPMMRKLKEFAATEDRPISEIVRRAVERVLKQSPLPPAPGKKFPTFHGGGVRVSAVEMKKEIYGDDE